MTLESKIFIRKISGCYINIPGVPDLVSEHDDDSRANETTEESNVLDFGEDLSQEPNVDSSFEEVKYNGLRESST